MEYGPRLYYGQSPCAMQRIPTALNYVWGQNEWCSLRPVGVRNGPHVVQTDSRL